MVIKFFGWWRWVCDRIEILAIQHQQSKSSEGSKLKNPHTTSHSALQILKAFAYMYELPRFFYLIVIILPCTSRDGPVVGLVLLAAALLRLTTEFYSPEVFLLLYQEVACMDRKGPYQALNKTQ